MSFSTSLENAILDHVFGQTAYDPADTLYVGLSTTTPNDAGGNFTEPSGGSYARVAVTNDGTKFGAAADGAKANSADITFPAATTNWGTITHFGLFEASSGGSPILTGALTLARAVMNGDVLKILAGALTITLD